MRMVSWKDYRRWNIVMCDENIMRTLRFVSVQNDVVARKIAHTHLQYQLKGEDL